MVFRVPSNWRVFVLDDDLERLRWFRQSMPANELQSARSAARAIEVLEREHLAFDLVFLDHDLSWMDAGFPDRLFGNGKEVARFLAIKGFAGRVIIHSKNEAGVAIMARTLTRAAVCRFGEFEIRTDSARQSPSSSAPRLHSSPSVEDSRKLL